LQVSNISVVFSMFPYLCVLFNMRYTQNFQEIACNNMNSYF
jgi:hypothetical protein